MVGVLRAVRVQRGLTLDALAASTGLTKSYLSKVERGRSVPSISAALKIAETLDVDVAQLFSAEAQSTALTVERVAATNAPRLHAVAAGMLGKAMTPFVLRPGRRFTTHPHPTHPGQEFVFVHAGAVELDYGGDLTLLDTGDCAYFDAGAPHKFRQAGEHGAVLIVVACQGPAPAGHKR